MPNYIQPGTPTTSGQTGTAAGNPALVAGGMQLDHVPARARRWFARMNEQLAFESGESLYQIHGFLTFRKWQRPARAKARRAAGRSTGACGRLGR